MTDEFYIGYLPQAAPGLATRVRRIAVMLLLAFVAVAAALVASMGASSSAVFEYGVEREFEGVVLAGPTPALLVERPGDTRDLPGSSAYLLVAPGKFGAAPALRGLDGRRVRLRGSLIYRDDQTMIELANGSVAEVSDGSAGSTAPGPLLEEELGTRALTGEIVDSKCFLGVMKPGNLKPHRACAVRCISGGIPPVLLVRGHQGFAEYYLLVSADGQAVNAEVLERVAETVHIEGRVVRRGGLMFLYADPATYR